MITSIDKNTTHFLTILMAGGSATYWAVASSKYLLPLVWLIFFSIWIVSSNPQEFKMFVKRFTQMGLVLLSVSLLQIIFRRQGTVILSLEGFPLIYSAGLREAILLWIRYMIIFMLAYVFARVSMFDFLLFLNKIRVSMQFSLLLLTTIKFIPFIFEEAKTGLWSLRFRGFDIGAMSVKEKYLALRKLFKPLLFRGVHFASFSSLALELRGYGVSGKVKLTQSYPLKLKDYFVLTIVVAINLVGILS